MQSRKTSSSTKTKSAKKQTLVQNPFLTAAATLAGVELVNALKKKTPSTSEKPSNKSMVISAFGKRFFDASVDPFLARLRGMVGIPTQGSEPSQKCAVKARVEVTIGTAGLGFLSQTAVFCNDLPALNYSTATFAGTTNSNATYVAGSSTNGVAVQAIPLPYQATQFLASAGSEDAALYGRVVAMGTRTVFEGTTLSDNGMMYSYSSPQNETIEFVTPQVLATLPEVVLQPVNVRRQLFTADVPCNQDQCNYLGQTTTFIPELSPWPYANTNGAVIPNSGSVSTAPGINSGVTNYPHGSTLLMFTGTPGQKVFVECIWHVEYQGGPSKQLCSPSCQDIKAFELAASIQSHMSLAQAADFIPIDRWVLARKAIEELYPLHMTVPLFGGREISTA